MTVAVEGGIDRRWLDEVAAAEPVRHAFAVWDLDHAPGLVDFVTLRVDGVPRGYLLIWKARPAVPVVSWVGDPHPALLEDLPRRPLIASVPLPIGRSVADRCAPSTSAIVWLMERPETRGEVGRTGAGRRLTPDEGPLLQELARSHPDPMTESYSTVDPATVPVFGVVRNGRLLSVARAQANTERAWMVGGVYTIPTERGRGYGGDVTRAAVSAAREAGAIPGLFVRELNVPARRIYERLGFRTLERRVLVDASEPAGSPPTPNGS